MRRFLPLLTILLGLVSLASAAAAKPNIVYIMADDLGIGDIGPFGQKKIRTPHLDRLAAEGTCFDQFYPGASVCSPTRSVLMTGQHTGHTRIRGNHGKAGVSRVPLKDSDITVAEVLKSAGYATAIAGKWGLGEPGNEGIPNRQGFDHWFGYLNNDLAEFYYPEKIWKNETEITLPGNLHGQRGQYSNDLMTEEALTFIDAHRTKPFFLYLAYTIPHSLLEVPADSLAEYAGKFPEPPPTGKGGKNDTAQPRATFAGMVTRLDREVGRVLGKLKALGLEESTIVFFCSDNGAPERNGLARFFGSTGAFRGFKGSLWEGGIHAPMIVRWPGKIPAGRRSDFPWAGWDFLPTAAALAGAKPPAGLDGIDVLPALRGEMKNRPGYLYWENIQTVFAQAVRIGDLKAVRHEPAAPIQVYDLRADPGETRDLASARPDFVARAAGLFRTARTDSEHWPVAAAGKPGKPAKQPKP
ncbi:MAG: arylsulfatase [Opitutaceae bacterium]|nr:arylsulfatase [Opitutaceae bacterium]